MEKIRLARSVMTGILLINALFLLYQLDATRLLSIIFVVLPLLATRVSVFDANLALLIIGLYFLVMSIFSAQSGVIPLEYMLYVLVCGMTIGKNTI